MSELRTLRNGRSICLTRPVGVKGCQVEFVLRDTQGDPKVGVDAAKNLVDVEGVPALIGAISSGVSLPILTSVASTFQNHPDLLLLFFTQFYCLSERGVKLKDIGFVPMPPAVPKRLWAL